MLNSDLAKIFNTFADIHEIIEDENSKFKVRAYRQASLTFQNLPKNIAQYINLDKNEFTEHIPGFGFAIMQKTIEYLKTGKITELEQLKKLIPSGLLDILELKNVGPKKTKRFYQELNIKSIKDLKKAILSKKVENLEGFGKKSADKILESIEKHEQYSERTPLGLIYPDLQELLTEFQKCPHLTQASIAGSARRFQETIGDVDILATGETKNHAKIIEYYKSLPQINKIEAEGETKVTAYLNSGIQIDLRVVQTSEFGSAMQYFSGNQSHNIKLRTLAKQKGYKINEYGIFDIKNNKKVGGSKEEDIYNILGLEYIPVYLRQGNNEIEVAQQKKIPTLIKPSDIKGDLHTHSTYSDGNHTIEEMTQAAIKLGYKYIAITDHSQSLKVANGLTPEKLKQKKAEIEQLKSKYNFPILFGTEVDILANGEIDYPDKILAEFDVVIASIHSNLDSNTTPRILKAMQNKYIQIIGHPTTRMINKREPSKLNFTEIFEMAKKTNTILEINAQPLRLDLPDNYIREAKENYGIKFAINTDSHNTNGLNLMEFGVHYACRGWITKHDVINTYSYPKLMQILKQKTNS